MLENAIRRQYVHIRYEICEAFGEIFPPNTLATTGINSNFLEVLESVPIQLRERKKFCVPATSTLCQGREGRAKNWKSAANFLG